MKPTPFICYIHETSFDIIVLAGGTPAAVKFINDNAPKYGSLMDFTYKPGNYHLSLGKQWSAREVMLHLNTTWNKRNASTPARRMIRAFANLRK